MARSVSKSQNPHGLTDQQLRFCQHYAVSLNATAAYKAAGYAARSESAARAGATVMLANASIRAYLGEVLDLTSVNVVSKIVSIAMTDITDVVQWDDESISLVPSDQLSAKTKAAIKTIKIKPKYLKDEETGLTERVVGEIEITMHDKLGALDKLAKKLKFYPKEIPEMNEMDLLGKMMEMNIAPVAIIEHASKIFGRTHQEIAALLAGQYIDVEGTNTEGHQGISEDTAARIRAEIMGIDAESSAALSTEVSEE
jgi:phage terminase small subunit